MWSLTNHGGRDEPPAQLGGQFPRRGLPPVEPWGEVVERLFAPPRLVDALQERVRTGRRMGHVDQKGGVGRPRHPSQDLVGALPLDNDGHLVVVDRSKNVATLTSGERFSPTFIENKVKFSSYVREAVCFGDGRDYPVLLINIDGEVVGKWAENQRIPYTTYTDLSQRPEVIDLIREETARVNSEMPSFMRVPRLAILHKELDADDAEMTRTRKVRRAQVEQNYAFIIDGLYSDRTEVDVDAEVTYRDGRKAHIHTQLTLVDVPVEAVQEVRV